MSDETGQDIPAQVFREVRNEYVRTHLGSPASRAKKNTRQDILSLMRKPLKRTEKEYEAGLFERWDAESATTNLGPIDAPTDKNIASLVLTTYTRNGAELEEESIEIACTTEVIKGVPSFGLSSRYEACAPSDTNLGYRPTDTTESATSYAPFMPYEDDEAIKAGSEPFNRERYFEIFGKDLSWASLDCPDVGAIEYEVVRRSRFQYGLSLDDIQSSKVWNREHRPSQESVASVVQSYVLNRDPPSWLLSRPKQDAELLSEAVSASSVGARDLLHGAVRAFCRICMSFHCARHTYDARPCEKCGRKFCSVHEGKDRYSTPEEEWDSLAGKNDIVIRKASKVTIDELRSHSMELGQSQYECTGPCFLDSTEDDWARVQAEMIAWSEEEEEELLCTLQFSDPDASPCDIGLWIGRPCIEVSLVRQRLIDQGRLASFEEGDQDSDVEDHVVFHDDADGLKIISPPKPCSHEGPCSASTTCPCKAAGFHCSFACLCDESCSIRWRSCKCAQRGEKCRGNRRCRCSKDGRECDVGVCDCSRARRTAYNMRQYECAAGAPAGMSLRFNRTT
ncbi:hypothetical protein PENSPDRAFT_240737 [Peniophora sp. CONT]|nr:hypothetical protein PENSPDRAFT_240737 [Peniophora sp. CONT]